MNQVQEFLKNGILPTVEKLNPFNSDKKFEIKEEPSSNVQQKPNTLEKKEIEKIETKEEVGLKKNEVCASAFENYKDEDKKRELGDFVKYFRNRYNSLRSILMNRPELQNAMSINRLKNKPLNVGPTGKSRERVSIIGIVKDKDITKNGNVILTLEDLTGEMTVLCSKTAPCFNEAKDIGFDEVIGISGSMGENIIFINELFLPDISLNNELKKSENEEYLVFTSDIHYGSKSFYETEFNNFILWLNGEYGDEKEREISKKVKYLFLLGDLVEGVGIYPGQDNDLKIVDIYDQYNGLSKYIERIRKDVKIFVIGGNHDALRLSEPQPAISKEFANSFYEMENVCFLSNPCLVNVCKTENFPGLNVLLYHGYSLHYLSQNVSSLKDSGGLNRVELIMKYLLQRRHLCPAYGSALFVPDTRDDPLIIKKVPDIFATGHVHKLALGNYRNVNLIQAGCWVGQTDYQEKQGMMPDPCKIVLVNSMSREIKVLDFLHGEKDE
ncbi:metallophosphoesterase [Candidatus Woesearchaeota archaeon]|nr:metallophosphoesterase [Candidatus Woesearchaeota archaeon]